ncbi:hypothetical protein BJY21_000921 [Kineosphaera limosa]|uniref:hypothetical protein n=1 Tax=Kineosphaera limosa TaxID=111564 RepID=UPI00031F3E8C|nr:hypothetical protein [Kineosphaera limosa]NYD99736.1 hypothetical protein [Kineosphaera limosa]
MNRRIPLALVTGSAMVLSLSACQWNSEITSMKQYDPADGVSAQLGNLHLNNLIVISDAEGGQGNVVGLAINGTDAPAQVQVSAVNAGQAGAAGAPLEVAAHSSQQLTEPEGGRATSIPTVQVPPGAMMQLLVQTNLGQTVVDVPVLPPEGYYVGYGPAGGAATSPATPAPGGTATPEPAPTQAPAPEPTQTPAETPTS